LDSYSAISVARETPKKIKYTFTVGESFMNFQRKNGFSLIELLIVVTVIGVIAAIAIPSLLGARTAAQRADAIAALQTVRSLQAMFRTSNTRYARLAEINQLNGNNLGTVVGPTLRRQQYVFQMFPTAPSDSQLTADYRIFATGQGNGGTIYQFQLEANGVITQIAP